MELTWIEHTWNSVRTFLSDPTNLSVSAVCMILYVAAFCRVFSKAGMSPLLGLLAIPPLTVVAPFYLAIAKWPKKG